MAPKGRRGRVVECTGLENQQSRKVLVGSNPTASAIPPRRARPVGFFAPSCRCSVHAANTAVERAHHTRLTRRHANVTRMVRCDSHDARVVIAEQASSRTCSIVNQYALPIRRPAVADLLGRVLYAVNSFCSRLKRRCYLTQLTHMRRWKQSGRAAGLRGHSSSV